MKLYISRMSPFVRKVLVMAAEAGIGDRVEPVEVTVSPVAPDPDVNRGNPLGKIPCLVTDDGTALYDSPVICEYLDAIHTGRKMFPPVGPQRWTALRRQALADGILDAAILARYEAALRPEERRWSDWVKGQKGKVERALDALEAEAPQLRDMVDIGTIAIACALGYLDFRFAEDNWREGRPQLADWYGGFSERRSMQQTRPPAG